MMSTTAFNTADTIERLKKYQVPYYAVYGKSGEMIHLSFPVPAYTHNEKLRWIKRKCPALYYKVTGESSERPMGYNYFRRRQTIKKNYRLVWEQKVYANFYGLGPNGWEKFVERRPALDGKNIMLTTEEAVKASQYKQIYMDSFAEMIAHKQPVRRLAAGRLRRGYNSEGWCE